MYTVDCRYCGFNKHLHACDSTLSSRFLVVAAGGREAWWSLSSSVVSHSRAIANSGHYADWAQHAAVAVPWPGVA